MPLIVLELPPDVALDLPVDLGELAAVEHRLHSAARLAGVVAHDLDGLPVPTRCAMPVAKAPKDEMPPLSVWRLRRMTVKT